jgi:hypothetical protein
MLAESPTMPTDRVDSDSGQRSMAMTKLPIW